MASKRNVANSDIVHINTRSRWFNIALIALCFCFLMGIRLQINPATGGDEPGYLLMDYSLVHDGDLNLKNQYQHQDWLKFMPWLSPIPQGNPAIVNMREAKVYSPHGVGLPLVLAPGFALAAKTGAVFTTVAIATLVVLLTWVWTNEVTGNRKLSYLTAGLLAICYFFTGLTGTVYPDMLIAAITLTVMIMLQRYYRSWQFQIIIGLLLGFLILVHYKTLDIIAPLLVLLGYKLWKSDRKLPWISTVIVLLFVAYYFLSLHQWFGVWSINTVYGSAATDFGNRPINNVTDMLFGSYRGLLVNNPILVLLFAGLPIWFKAHRQTFIMSLVAVGPSILVLATYSQWAGGDSPLGRYIIEFLPILMPAVAIVLSQCKALWQRLVVLALGILTFLISLDNALVKFPPYDGTQDMSRAAFFAQIQHHSGVALDKLVPIFNNSTVLVGSHRHIKVIIYYLAIIGLMVYGYFLSRSVQPVSAAR